MTQQDHLPNEVHKSSKYRFPLLTFMFLMIPGSLFGIAAYASAAKGENLGYFDRMVEFFPFWLAIFSVAISAAVINHLLLGGEDREKVTVGDFGIMVLGILAIPLAVSFVPGISEELASCLRVISLASFGIMAGATVILVTVDFLMDRFSGTHPE